MKAIRYDIHFATLAIVAIIFWLVRDFRLPTWISNFNFLHYALMGALHATSIVVSLRGRRTSLRALGFIALATALSAFAPIMGLIATFVWVPFADVLRETGLSADVILVTGSAIGASGYWLLVQLFWSRPFRRAGWFWAVAFCVASTLLVGLSLRILDGSDRGISEMSQKLTFGWWLAFSSSLYWSESTGRVSGTQSPPLALTRKAMIGLGIALPVMLLIWYVAAVWWAPMDAVTMTLPQGIRDTVSNVLLGRADFSAKGFPAARRAARFSPGSEEAWAMLCATGVSDGTDMEGALKDCSRAASMTDNSFHAQVIAQAYAEAHRPCDGLPVLMKTMGQEAVNNISPIFSMGRLEAACGDLNNAEKHLRAVVRLREEDLRSNNWEDRPPGADGPPDTYEKSFRLSLSEARQNLSSLLTMRHKDAEAFDACRSALGIELKRCTCRFKAREGVACDFSATE